MGREKETEKEKADKSNEEFGGKGTRSRRFKERVRSKNDDDEDDDDDDDENKSEKKKMESSGKKGQEPLTSLRPSRRTKAREHGVNVVLSANHNGSRVSSSRCYLSSRRREEDGRTFENYRCRRSWIRDKRHPYVRLAGRISHEDFARGKGQAILMPVQRSDRCYATLATDSNCSRPVDNSTFSCSKPLSPRTFRRSPVLSNLR